jgi:hypothetical protein
MRKAALVLSVTLITALPENVLAPEIVSVPVIWTISEGLILAALAAAAVALDAAAVALEAALDALLEAAEALEAALVA